MQYDFTGAAFTCAPHIPRINTQPPPGQRKINEHKKAWNSFE